MVDGAGTRRDGEGTKVLYAKVPARLHADVAELARAEDTTMTLWVRAALRRAIHEARKGTPDTSGAR